MSQNIPEIFVDDYNYELDESLIASFPNVERGNSKLLIINDNSFQDAIFSDVANFLPRGSLFLLNDSRVFPARVCMQRKSGGLIELLFTRALSKTSWLALAKNSKRWKTGETIFKKFEQGFLAASLVANKGTEVELELHWEPTTWELDDLLQRVGDVPLPPYLNRKATEIDVKRYQTVYATKTGSAAAPTAGLHFTHELMDSLTSQGHQFEQITLHVGPGTFLPVKTNTLNQHNMHIEMCNISVSCLKKLTSQLPLVAVGTTTLRTIESFYWAALPLLQGHSEPLMVVPQFAAFYHNIDLPEYQLVFEALKKYLIARQLPNFWIQTKLMLLPGMSIQTANYLITNFHQPKSTLLTLVEAFVGPVWKNAYAYAKNQHYRFLSYGDACLFTRKISQGLK